MKKSPRRQAVETVEFSVPAGRIACRYHLYRTQNITVAQQQLTIEIGLNFGRQRGIGLADLGDGFFGVHNLDRAGHQSNDGDGDHGTADRDQDEERQRFGYRIVTAYRFPEVGGKLDRTDAEVYCGEALAARLSYGERWIKKK